MLLSFTHHKSGVDWLTSTDYWNDVLSYCLENQTIYITREGYNFMYELLNKSIKYNNTFCDLVVKKTMSRLETDRFVNNESAKLEIDDYQLQKDLSPTLKLITYILEQLYMSGECKTLVDMYLHEHNLENVLWNLLLIARDEEFVYDISKSIFLTSFMGVGMQAYVTRESALPELKVFGRKFMRLFQLVTERGLAVLIVRLCCLGHGYWTRVDRLLPPSDKLEPILFENQIIVFQILPVIVVAFAASGEGDGHRHMHEDELTALFVHKLFKISCEHTVRMAYAYRALLLGLGEAQACETARKAVGCLMSVRDLLHRDRAVIAFQALAYALRSLVEGRGVRKTAAQQRLLSALLDALGQLIRHFHITWTDSVESICITSLALELVEVVEQDEARLRVEALQLTHLTVAHFMPPNLALLVVEAGERPEAASSIGRLAGVLAARLSDSAWEVRDCALETLRTVVEISAERYPPFVGLVCAAGLPAEAVRLAKLDQEAYVRGTAVRALAAMARLSSYWPHLCSHRLPELAVQTCTGEGEEEGVARREWAGLVLALLAGGRLTNNHLTHACAAMRRAALHDLHWEVRAAALDFWRAVIEQELAGQGMLDGAFPPVTFSRDRKIVSLTGQEVRARLTRALESLAASGCLLVLVRAAADLADLQVARRAADISRELADQLRKYGLLEEAAAAQTGDEDWERVQEVGPLEFVRFLARDPRAAVDARQLWLQHVTDDLGSLLDDILHSYDVDVHVDADDRVNSMDCY